MPRADDCDAPDGSLQTAAFIPSPQQIRYLAAVIDPNLRTRDSMSKAARINPTTIWRWQQNPDFIAWLIQQVQRTFGLKYSIALDKALDLAIQGSPEHLKLMMMKFGDLRHGNEEQGRAAQQIAVHINVPRPEPSAPQRQAPQLETIDIIARPMLPPINESEH